MPAFELQRLYIGGAYVDATSGETFDTLDPATGETLATRAAGERPRTSIAPCAPRAKASANGPR